MYIKDILTINLSEDIKNVIDLEDISDAEILSEIENYIVTDGLAKDYSDFISTFNTNIKETGCWISGFYGSGKSYFGKLLGYMLSNRPIGGTPARERILQRFIGIENEDIIKNSISKLNSINSRVIFLDIAKQDTSKGLAYTLFRNFMRSLELPQNEHGYLLYQLMINDKQFNVHDFISQYSGLNWADIRTNIIQYSRVIKSAYIQKGNTEDDYKIILGTIRGEIDQFSSSSFREKLDSYLSIEQDERLIFLFDEASEAINQQKFTLLDLEGLSESLSSLGGKVWTIAIAQEKLDDIINNSNVSKAQLTKVTDRFKTKIHLEATEVDVIIKSRLLKKNDSGIALLKQHYKANSGKIVDHASLIGSGISKTDNEENYSTYYPFYKYQFDLLQNFLFGTKGYASTKVAARGMIITTYDILKQGLQNKELFSVVTGWQITKEAQPQPHVRLVGRYTNAERILKEEHSSISGRKLLETINFLTEAEVAPTTLPNIVKSYTSDPEQSYVVQEEILLALEKLTEAKVLLDTNKTYRITSDIEQRLLDEMNGFTVQGFVKKKQAITTYKAANLIKTISKVSESNLQYDFYITTDNEDELTNPGQKSLKIRLKSIYNISDDRSADIEALKNQYQNDKDILFLVPDNTAFKELDKLIDEVERIGYLEQKYNNPSTEEGKIMQSFSTAKSEKQNRIKDLIDYSLYNATAIYLYNTFQLDENNWQTIVQGQQKQIIQNVYCKRLASQLAEGVASSVIKEANDVRLQQYFHGDDFQFFDNQGNFTGNNLKVVEEILYKIRNAFVDGATLEKDLEMQPTGFTLGSVMSTVAALLRGGKVIAKYNGNDLFSWRDGGVVAMFSAAREFRRASFKQVSKSLTIAQKQELAQCLLDINADEYIGRKVNYNTNDFELVNAVRDLAKHFVDKVTNLRNIEKEFEKLFPAIETEKDFLLQFTGAVSEANYIDKAVVFLTAKSEFLKALQAIEKVEKFIRNNLPKVKEWTIFVGGVNDELTKAAKKNEIISGLSADYKSLYSQDLVKNYAALQQTVQKIKDEYHILFEGAVANLSKIYTQLEADTEALIEEINSLPAGLNTTALSDANELLRYASQRMQKIVTLGFEVKDKQSRFTYSEVLSFIDLYNSKKANMDIIQAGLIRVAPPVVIPGTIAPVAPNVLKTFSSTLPGRKVKVSEYKQWLKQELKKVASFSDNDEIEIN